MAVTLTHLWTGVDNTSSFTRIKESIVESEVLTTTAGSNGSLAAVTGATKAFVLAHPIGMAVVGGALLGLGTYYALGKLFGKKKAAAPNAVAA
jgi:hypothetical protein